MSRSAIAILVSVALLSAVGAHAAPASEDLQTRLLSLDPEESARLEDGKAKGLLTIDPVVLPEGVFLKAVNGHLGWPVATMAGDTLIVVFHRIPAHWGGKKRDKFSSVAVITRSSDGGATWSEPVDVRTFIKEPSKGVKAAFGNAICTDSKGIVHLLTTYGLFQSGDRGESWTHLPGAFTESQLKGPRTNMGPLMIEHPQYGLVVAGHDTRKGHFPVNDIWLRYSQDKGQTWKEATETYPSFARPIEPTLLLHDGALLVLARCHDGYEADNHTWRYVQLYSKTGWLPLEPKLTNIRTSDTTHWEGGSQSKGFGPWSQDTVDLAFNPVSGRIEAVATNRMGGGPEKLDVYTHMTLNLWSIAPEELAAGSAEWRFEGTLLTRRGTSVIEPFSDGMHPGGAVIDEERGMQHIFVYLGYTHAPAGIFRISRTLDTKKLSAWLKKQP